MCSEDNGHFYLAGTVNKQYFRYLDVENPKKKLYTRPLQSS